MKQAYLTGQPSWRQNTWQLLNKITAIVEDFNSQGYKMTLRQLYYQLVLGMLD